METKKTQRTKKPLIAVVLGLAAVLLILGIVLLLSRCDGGNAPSANGGDLAKLLAEEGEKTITLDEDIILDSSVTINGQKTIVGTGSILLKTELEGQWPQNTQPSWGMGCIALEAEDAAAMPAMLQVSKGSSLTIGGSVTIDAEGNANGILLEAGASAAVSEGAIIKNGRYANLVVCKDADAQISGGALLDGAVYKIINYGELDLTDGTVSGA